MKLVLPQNDPKPEKRIKALEEARKTYTYNYEYIPGAPMSESVPHKDWPSIAWMEKVAVKLVTILANTAKVDMQLKRERREEIRHHFREYMRHPITHMIERIKSGEIHRPSQDMKHVAEVLEKLKSEGIGYAFNRLVAKVLVGGSKGRADSLAAYAELFKKIPNLTIEDTYAEDETFAQMRVQGPNPVIMQRIPALDDRFPVTDEIFQLTMGPKDTLAAAGAEGRLYICDYQAVDNAQCGVIPDGQKFINAPMALFAVPRANGNGVPQLRPVAIQCRQAPGENNPIFTPKDGHGWMIAKSIVQTADGNIHQAVSHLARSHLVLECFVMASRRQLAPNHPLRGLLEPHYEGTISINDQAQSQLMGTGGIVDQLLSGKIEVSRALAAQGRADWSFNTAMPRDEFAGRGVDDADALPYYPYRDDALLLWDAIHEWVGAFLGIHYPNGDADIRADTELQNWIEELMSEQGGRMKDIGQDGRIQTLDYLVNAATLVIFTCSCQHSAVNFPQYELMAYAVNYPLAGYKDAPMTKEGLSEQDYLDVLPPLDMAHLQLDIGYLLGGIHYTTLGGYPDHLLRSYFGDSRVNAALKKFQKRLKEIEEEVQRRNADRPTPYIYLQPSSIPQSINI